MKWFKKIFQSEQDKTDIALQSIQDKLEIFLSLLQKHNRVLTVISDMEEMLQRAEPFDIGYIRSSLMEVRSGMSEIIEDMITIGGSKYEVLRDRFVAIEYKIANILPGARPVCQSDYIVPFEQLNRDQINIAGSKNAQLGELKNRLGVPVPNGFAITAWAYKHFIEKNNLRNRIQREIKKIDLQHYDDLERISNEVQNLVKSSPVPDDLAHAILDRYKQLNSSDPYNRVALRSSAIAEDSLYSFAGQYASILNVREQSIIKHYCDVLASQFSPKAIYYLLSHSLLESEFAMGVGCVEMVNAAASGVVYTRDPINPDNDCMLIHSIYGLGKYLVDGTLTPDVFRISRQDKRIIKQRITQQSVRLGLCPDEGIKEESVEPEAQQKPSISEEHLMELADYALRIEKHYEGPQDIEWSIDQEGRLCILQTRPLRVVQPQKPADEPDVSHYEILLSGGSTVFPGAGGGPVFHVCSTQNLSEVPEGAVLVAHHPFPGLITVMNKVSALVTEIGSVASHMATLAREVRLPTLVGVKNACQLTAGETVTVDATKSCIYAGELLDLIEKRTSKYELFENTARYQILQRILSFISPLNLLNPTDADFTPENCQTYHDMIRFVHQKALEEMFAGAKKMKDRDLLSARLKSDIPLPVNIISIDRDCLGAGGRWISEDEICSELMKSFWGGIKEQGWPSHSPSADIKGFMSAVATTMTMGSQPEFQENSFAIISKEYMILSLNLGYHFTTIEAICSEEEDKSYIRFQHKGGGAPFDRRARRVQLLVNVFSRLGFEYISKGDYFEGKISYLSFQEIREKLRLLGRLCMLTKQLDMALSNDAIAQWYSEDIIKKLELKKF